MCLTIRDLNVKIKDFNTGQWVRLESDVEAVIYLIIFKPQDNIYEKRRPNTHPDRIHEINGGEVVFKPGKSNTSLESRLLSSYSKHWKYHYEEYPPIGEKRTYSDCFRYQTEIFVLHVQDDLDEELLRLLENETIVILNETLNVVRQENGSRSEYYLSCDNNQISIQNISIIKNTLDQFIENLGD